MFFTSQVQAVSAVEEYSKPILTVLPAYSVPRLMVWGYQDQLSFFRSSDLLFEGNPGEFFFAFTGFFAFFAFVVVTAVAAVSVFDYCDKHLAEVSSGFAFEIVDGIVKGEDCRAVLVEVKFGRNGHAL